jgi:osmotically-inducible protein OsmY
VKIRFRRQAATVCAYGALGALGLHAIAAVAQPTGTAQAAPPASDTAASGQELSDQALVERVQAALQADPYVFNKHITVSVESGAVVLRGFVFSDLDLRSAVRIATKAAGNARVINYLTIKATQRR